MEEIDEPGSARCLTGTRKLAPIDNDIDRARLAGIRAPGDSDLTACIRGELIAGVGALNKASFRVLRHGGTPRKFRV